MISSEDFVTTLKDRGVYSFTGVPCSFFQSAVNRVIADRDLTYTIAPNEGSALALASGAYLSGGRMAVMIQNSGFGNLINPLTSLNLIYRIPALIFMSGRAYGVEDEPQHEIMGRCMVPLLDAMGVRHEDMPDEKEVFEVSLDRALSWMQKDKRPFFYLVKKETVDECGPKSLRTALYPMTRLEAIRIVSQAVDEKTLLIATTGKPSRELFAVRDRAQNFYMQGSMGHAASIGLGVALQRPDKKVVVLDGDGAILMHFGILSTIGHCRPKNLVHVVLDNEAYETTGDQDTTSATTDFVTMAKAAGYVQALQVADAESLGCEFKRLLSVEGPSFLRVKINRTPTPDIPRISSRYTSEEIASNFLASIQ